MTASLLPSKAIQDRVEAARYLADQVKALAAVAKRHRLDTLSYLLDMAELEASQISELKPPIGK